MRIEKERPWSAWIQDVTLHGVGENDPAPAKCKDWFASDEDRVSLGELVDALSAHVEAGGHCTLGFCCPHSYRGDYSGIAFEPIERDGEASARAMLSLANEAMGEAYEGWKGGKYTMDQETPVYIASKGSTGWPLTAALLKAMLPPRK
jgi:hypothetical protein